MLIPYINHNKCLFDGNLNGGPHSVSVFVRRKRDRRWCLICVPLEMEKWDSDVDF